MPNKKYDPFVDALSLIILFFIGYYFNLFGSSSWKFFFLVSIFLVLIGAILSLFFGQNLKISISHFLNLFLLSIYVIAIIIGLNFLFQFILMENFTYLIEHIILVIFFFIIFVLSLRDIFLNLYLGNGPRKGFKLSDNGKN